MKTQAKIDKQSQKYTDNKRKKMKKIVLPKNKNKAKNLLVATLGAAPTAISGHFELRHGITIIRNPDETEALKDLGTIMGYYYEKEK